MLEFSAGEPKNYQKEFSFNRRSMIFDLIQVLENEEELKYHSTLARKKMKKPANG